MAKSRDKPIADLPTFESSLRTLEVIVERLERDDNTLNAALEEFEKGILLVRQAQDALGSAEQKVRLLLDSGGSQTIAPPTSDGTEGSNGT
jgi:exodeoxyribonuclease VII small subunit